MICNQRSIGARFALAATAFAAAWRGAGCIDSMRSDHGTTDTSSPTPQADIDSMLRPKCVQRRSDGDGLEAHSAAEHARRLLLWLQEPGGLTGPVLARDLQVIHREMSAEIGWKTRPWNPVGRQLALLLSGGRKTWAWVTDPRTGRRQRLRVYQIPRAAVTAATPVPVSRPTPQCASTPRPWSPCGRRLAA